MFFISTKPLNTRLQLKHTHHQYLQKAIKFTDRKNGHFLKPGKNNNQTNRSKLKWIKVFHGTGGGTGISLEGPIFRKGTNAINWRTLMVGCQMRD